MPTFESRELRATGAGSVVNLNNITNLANPSGAGLLYIRAFSGGQILLAGVNAIPSSRLGLWAEGVGTNAAPSLVHLPNLTNSPAGGTFIEARNGGTMNIPNLTAPISLDLTLRGTNTTFPMAQFTTLSNSALTVDAVNLTLTNVMVINSQTGTNIIDTAVSLLPGAVSNFTGSFTVPVGMLCTISSFATATGREICAGNTLTNSATNTCTLATAPEGNGR